MDKVNTISPLNIIEAVSDEKLWESYNQTKSVDLRNQIVVKYSKIVKYIAMKTVNNFKAINYLDDIINEGLITLMDAVEKFDPSRNVKFETFASIKIRGAIIDYIRKQDCFPRRIKKEAKALNEAINHLNNELGYTPTNEQIAAYLQITTEKLEKMQYEAYSLSVLSFEQLVYESYSDDSHCDSLCCDIGDLPETKMAEEELIEILGNNIKNLNEKEQLVISLYYKEQLKIKEIAQILDISDSRVSQIHSSAINKLRSSLENYMKI